MFSSLLRRRVQANPALTDPQHLLPPPGAMKSLTPPPPPLPLPGFTVPVLSQYRCLVLLSMESEGAHTLFHPAVAAIIHIYIYKALILDAKVLVYDFAQKLQGAYWQWECTPEQPVNTTTHFRLTDNRYCCVVTGLAWLKSPTFLLFSSTVAPFPAVWHTKELV